LSRKKREYGETYEYKLPGGKSVDVVAEKDGKRIAIKIKIRKSDAVYNVRKDLEAGFDGVICVCLYKRIEDEIISQIKSIEPEQRKRIQIETITN